MRLYLNGNFRRILRFMVATITLMHTPASLACGWFGDGESQMSISDAIIVDSSGDEISTRMGLHDADKMFQKAETVRRSGGGRRDHQQMLSWYERAASSGHIGAQYTLGLLYETGIMFKANIERAANWYRFAAGQGEPHAQHHLGMMYQDGRGVAQDDHRAIHWLETASEQGHVGAMPLLAQLYWGRGDKDVNRVMAYQWWLTASQLGNRDSQNQYMKISPQLSDRERSQAESQSARWLQSWKQADVNNSVN